MADFVQTMKDWRRMCKDRRCDVCRLRSVDGICNTDPYSRTDEDIIKIENTVTEWAAEHPEPVYETWFEYLLRIGVIPENAPAGGEYQWIVESIKHKHISNDIAESLKLHPKEVQA